MRGANRDLLTSVNWPCIRISRWYKEHRPLLHVENMKYTKAQRASFRNASCVTHLHGTEVEQNLLCNMKMFDVITLTPVSQDPHRPTCTRQFITQGALKDSISSIFCDCYNLFCWKYIYKHVLTLSGHCENIIIARQKWSYCCPTEFFFFTPTQIIQDWLQC